MNQIPSNLPGQKHFKQGLRVLVVGLGRFGGGVGVSRWLVSQGAKVTVTDLADQDSLQTSVDALQDCQRITFHLGGHDLDDLATTDMVVINPAVVKCRSSFFSEILKREIPWTTEMNLFCQRCPAPIIGITGSYGKSTTASQLALVMEAHQQEGRTPRKVLLGGNIGRSLLSELNTIDPHDWVILEMSNAQLEDLPRIDRFPFLAIITNLHPHHLDRYPSYADYIQAKLNIINPLDPTQRVIVGELEDRAEKWLLKRIGQHPERVGRVESPQQPFELKVPGHHNQQNAACAFRAARELGVADRTAREALRTYRGLPHRLEYVLSRSHVVYINDSKSTSPSSIITALDSLDRKVIAIVGGQQKKVDLSQCAIALKASARSVIGFGESGGVFLESIAELGIERDAMTLRRATDLGDAVRLAIEMANKGDIVLFSPGTPSFDAYANFAERGDHFVKCVKDQ